MCEALCQTNVINVMLLKSVRILPLPDEFMYMLIDTMYPCMTKSFTSFFSATSGYLRITGTTVCTRPSLILAGARCKGESCFNRLIHRALSISRVLTSSNLPSLAVAINVMTVVCETSTRRGEFVTSPRTVGLIRGGYSLITPNTAVLG